MRAPSRLLAGLVVVVVLGAGCSADDPSGGATPADPSSSEVTPDEPTASVESEAATPETQQPEPSRPVRAVSVPGLAEQRHRGDRLRLGAVREQTAAYTSYDVTYRSR